MAVSEPMTIVGTLIAFLAVLAVWWGARQILVRFFAYEGKEATGAAILLAFALISGGAALLLLLGLSFGIIRF